MDDTLEVTSMTEVVTLIVNTNVLDMYGSTTRLIVSIVTIRTRSTECNICSSMIIVILYTVFIFLYIIT